MVKGVSAKFQSYEETVPRFLSFVKFDQQIMGKKAIVLLPSLKTSSSHNTPTAFVEEVIRFCLSYQDEDAKIIIAAGADGEDTFEAFEEIGYTRLAEHYPVSLVDLNTADTEEIDSNNFLKFETILYPKILKDGYLVSLPRLNDDEETEMQGSVSTLLGAYPSTHYKGFFSKNKSKIRKWPIKYSIHDIAHCKLPDAVFMDASDYGYVFAGKQALDLDKQAAKLLGKEWKNIAHLKLLDDSIGRIQEEADYRQKQKEAKEEANTLAQQ